MQALREKDCDAMRIHVEPSEQAFQSSLRGELGNRRPRSRDCHGGCGRVGPTVGWLTIHSAVASRRRVAGAVPDARAVRGPPLFV
jgi:hypothetical protein